MNDPVFTPGKRLPESIFPLQLTGHIDLGAAEAPPGPAAYRSALADALARSGLSVVQGDDAAPLYFERTAPWWRSPSVGAHRGEVVVDRRGERMIARYRLHFHHMFAIFTVFVGVFWVFLAMQGFPWQFGLFAWLWIAGGNVVVSWLRMRWLLWRAIVSARKRLVGT